ncbi:MAG: ABC transporter substrate-binding protein [Acidobacteriota bacterium]
MEGSWVRALSLAAAIPMAAASGCAPAVPTPPHSVWPAVPFDGVANLAGGCVDDFDPAADYFPDKVRFRHSEQLEVEYRGHYKVVTLRPRTDPERLLRWVLVQCGTPAPEVPRGTVIEVPVKRFAVTPVGWAGAVDALGLADHLAALGTVQRLTTPSLIARVASGELVEIGRYHHTDVERLLDLEAGLVVDHFTAYADSEIEHLLAAVGAPVALDAQHLEATPLAASEWVAWLALFFNRERVAKELLAGIEERYQRLAVVVEGVRNRPVVVTDWFDKDAWNVFGADNAFAHQIADAGGDYFWQEDTPLNWFEVPLISAFERAAEADHWIWVPPNIRNLDDALAQEQRLAALPVVQRGELYSFDAGSPEPGRAPFYDRMLIEPDVVLADMIRVFHPERLPEHRLVFFRRLGGAPSQLEPRGGEA